VFYFSQAAKFHFIIRIEILMYMHIFFIVLSKTCYYNISYNEFTCDKVMSPLILTNADQTQIYGRGHLTNYQAKLSVAIGHVMMTLVVILNCLAYICTVVGGQDDH
jgi:hypothetical protein